MSNPPRCGYQNLREYIFKKKRKIFQIFFFKKFHNFREN